MFLIIIFIIAAVYFRTIKIILTFKTIFSPCTMSLHILDRYDRNDREISSTPLEPLVNDNHPVLAETTGRMREEGEARGDGPPFGICLPALDGRDSADPTRGHGQCLRG